MDWCIILMENNQVFMIVLCKDVLDKIKENDDYMKILEENAAYCILISWEWKCFYAKDMLLLIKIIAYKIH